MTFGRAASSVTASLAVVAGAIVVFGMTHDDHHSSPAAGRNAAAHPATPTARPALIPATGATAPTATATATSSASPTTAVVTRATTAPTATHAADATTSRTTTSHATTSHTTTSHATTSRTTTSHTTVSGTSGSATAPKGAALPLGFSTGNATKVITVVAHSHASTTARLQAWSKAPGGGWTRRGSAVKAHVGTDGMTRHASESRSATPIGSFTLTRAFGRHHNPGTSLPYVHTTPADWWISQPGKLYNTLQVCSSDCPFTQGSPNEHLYYETPYYDYAVVIDYNTRNAPGGVHQGKGSAFFLHVHPRGTGGTAGCVDIPVHRLTSIMRWLTPGSHARILIGVRH